MVPHDHREYVEGCFRCELSRDEVDVPTSLPDDDQWHTVTEVERADPVAEGPLP